MKTALRRLHLFPIYKGDGLDTKQKLRVLAELASLGYHISNPEMLDQANPSLFIYYPKYIEELKKMRGDNVDYVPLFTNFPDIPEDDEYFVKRLVGYIGNFIDLFDQGTTLENGLTIPNWLFDLNEFGADPITQFQDKTLFEKGKNNQKKREQDTHTEWITLEIEDVDNMPKRLLQWAQTCLYTKSPIKEELHNEIKEVIDWWGISNIDRDKVVMKENFALLVKHLWKTEEYSQLSQWLDTPTDILRLFAALTDTDISLSENIEFPKLTRQQRRFILSIIEKSNNRLEDLNRYKRLWLKIGQYIHPTEYKKQFPLTEAAFDVLRNGKASTFNGQVEKFIKEKNIEALLLTLKQRPTIFARKLNEILNKFSEYSDDIRKEFSKVSSKVPTKVLLMLLSHLRTLPTREKALVINKKGKARVLDNKYIGTNTNTELLHDIRQSILDQLKTKDTWKGYRVFIDPRLKKYTVPFQQRKATDGLLNVGRGSRISIDDKKVIRLFVYWKQRVHRTDIDLSVVLLDKDLNNVGHVSYTELETEGVTHSGDIQSAQYGASEFIDIKLEKLSNDVRYIIPQVFVFAGEGFDQMTCHAGWMMRDKVKQDIKTFDAKTVANKFDINKKSQVFIPFILDVEEKEIVSVDLPLKGLQYCNRVEGSNNAIDICKEILDFTETRPNMYELFYMNTIARGGTLVQEDSDISIGLSKDDTFNALNIEEILSEFI